MHCGSFKRQFNWIKVLLNCLKFICIGMRINDYNNPGGVIDNFNNSLIQSSRRKSYEKDPNKTIKIIGVI